MGVTVIDPLELVPLDLLDAAKLLLTGSAELLIDEFELLLVLGAPPQAATELMIRLNVKPLSLNEVSEG